MDLIHYFDGRRLSAWTCDYKAEGPAVFGNTAEVFLMIAGIFIKRLYQVDVVLVRSDNERDKSAVIGVEYYNESGELVEDGRNRKFYFEEMISHLRSIFPQ